LFDWSTALETLRTLGTDVAAAPSVADACSAIQHVLAGNPCDIPFAALYLLDDRHYLVRMSATGVVPDGRQLPTAVSVDENTGPWPFASVITTKQSADVSQAVVLPISRRTGATGGRIRRRRQSQATAGSELPRILQSRRRTDRRCISQRAHQRA
jgi:hypothetical protein